MHLDDWILRFAGAQRCVQRLYCFSYAGGSAFDFLSWRAALSPNIEMCAVQLPGRGSRLAETPYVAMPALVEALTPAVARHSELPFAFYGHSLGGLVAFEVARRLALFGLRMPIHLFVSGSPAPRHRGPPRQVHQLDDAALIEVLKDYNGTRPEVLANRELVKLLLPAVRADFALAETYQYRDGLRLTLPITVMAGRGDDCSSDEQVYGWQRETTGPCRVMWFDGDHFFIHPHREAILACLNGALSERLCA